MHTDLDNFIQNLCKKSGTLSSNNSREKIENFMISQILKAFPEDKILSKNKKINLTNNTKERIWIIEGLSGEKNKEKNLNFFTSSIAIFENKMSQKSKNYEYLSGELTKACIFSINNDELFFAKKNHGSFLNNKKIKVSKNKTLKNSLIFCEFPKKYEEENINLITSILEMKSMPRTLGSATLSLAYVAAGYGDGFCANGLDAWEIASGLLILKEAGGHISDLNGQLPDLFGKNILATNTLIHSSFLKQLDS